MSKDGTDVIAYLIEDLQKTVSFGRWADCELHFHRLPDSSYFKPATTLIVLPWDANKIAVTLSLNRDSLLLDIVFWPLNLIMLELAIEYFGPSVSIYIYWTKLPVLEVQILSSFISYVRAGTWSLAWNSKHCAVRSAHELVSTYQITLNQSALSLYCYE